MKDIVDEIIANALAEDIGEGDHSTLACVDADATGVAKLYAKDEGVIAGVELAERIFSTYDPSLALTINFNDGDIIKPGDVVLEVTGSSRSILSTERLVLNFMQRMSGIATYTRNLSKIIEGTGAKLLDTRKTTPGIRYMEKWAVRIGGGYNHRYALYDMIMLKDNHIDYAGGIAQAISKTHRYLEAKDKDLKIEIEVRNVDELEQVIACGGVDRIMLDNFSPDHIVSALALIPSDIETEASGGITEETILAYAKTGVDFISVGALTHSVDSLDLSLKAYFN